MRLTRTALSKIRIGIRITNGIVKRVRVLLGPVGLELGGQLLLSLLPSYSVGTAFGNRVLRGLQAPGVSTMGFGKGLGLGGSGGDGSISLGLRRASSIKIPILLSGRNRDKDRNKVRMEGCRWIIRL